MSKFDDSYNKIISESYHRQLGLMWTESSAKRSISNMLKKGFNIDDVLADFDNFLVPKKWFSFKKLFSAKPEIKIDSFSGKNCTIQVIYTQNFSENEIKNLIYGKEGKKEKIGGIIYNEELTSHLEHFEFKLPPDLQENPDNDEEGEDDDLAEDSPNDSSADDGLEESASTKNKKPIIMEASNNIPTGIKVIFYFSRVNYIKNIKARQMKNPNYIESFSGNVYLGFGDPDNEDGLIKLGTVTYAQSRFANMNPPKPIKDQIKEMWDKPNKDFGMWGNLAQKGMAAAANGIFGGLFSKTIQEESLDIKLDNKFQYNNNTKGGNLEKRSDKIVTAKSIINKKFVEKYAGANSGFNLSDNGDNKFKLIFKVGGVAIFKIDVEQSK